MRLLVRALYVHIQSVPGKGWNQVIPTASPLHLLFSPLVFLGATLPFVPGHRDSGPGPLKLHL